MVFALICGILGVGSGAMLLFVSGYLISKSALQPENIMIVYVPIVSVRAFSIGQAAFLYVEKLISHDLDRKSTRLNSSHVAISYAVFCLKKKTEHNNTHERTIENYSR